MLRRAGLLAALTALLVPAVAGTTANAKTRAPVVTRITPKHVYVGETMTIRGHHFRRGLNKNTVAFKRSGAKAVFVTADKGTTKMLRFKLPKRLEKILVVKNGTPTPTRLQVRVLAAKFGKRFTKRSASPVVGPEKPPAPPKPAAVDPNADCDGDGVINRIDADDDNDLLSDSLEKSYGLDECNVDSDRDGVEDGYEYESAQDLNQDHDHVNVPYPAKRPYPNPLDKTDADTDHDGDTLTLDDEYKLWKYTTTHGSPRTLSPLTYSAGEKYTQPWLNDPANYDKQAAFVAWTVATGRNTLNMADLRTLVIGDTVPTAWQLTDNRQLLDFDRNGVVDADESSYNDSDGDGHLDDGERDEDADGLPNEWESRGCMTQGFWNGVYTKEKPYYLNYDRQDFRLDDADSDGDGVLDGADDEDHDNIPNVMECSRSLAGAGASPSILWQGWVNPFNPCLPHVRSDNCNEHVTVGDGAQSWAPFKDDNSLMVNYDVKN
jgi:hypothetical protein